MLERFTPQKYKIYINNKEIIDEYAICFDNENDVNVRIPIRGVFEKMGAEVRYLNSKKIIVKFKDGSYVIELNVGFIYGYIGELSDTLCDDIFTDDRLNGKYPPRELSIAGFGHERKTLINGNWYLWSETFDFISDGISDEMKAKLKYIKNININHEEKSVYIEF